MSLTSPSLLRGAILAAVAVAAVVTTSAVRAELNVDITQGFVEPLPVAVT